MSIIKECSCCCGLIEFPDSGGMLACPACGTQNQSPKVQGAVLETFRHAIRLHAGRAFCDAEASYQFVLHSHPDEPEALWGRLMCHYGAELIEDKGVRRYTIHFPRPKPLHDQVDYKQACELAEPAIRARYEQDAVYIDQANQRILELSKTKPAFDIFLCHKTTPLVGEGYTEDYNRAYHLYNLLTKKGYRVFFAPVEMEGISAGEDYEAGIHHALKTSKVMLVVCSTPLHLTSKWVKSEWRRYLDYIGAGEDKVLIPLLYGGMKPGDLPREYQNHNLQAINMELGGDQQMYKAVRRHVKPRGRCFGAMLRVLLMLMVLAALGAGAYFLLGEFWNPCEHTSSSWQTETTYKRSDSTYHTVTEAQIKICNDCGKELDQKSGTSRQEPHTYVGGECTQCEATPMPPVTTPPVTTPPVTTPPVTTPPATPTPTPKPISFNISISFDNKTVQLTWESVAGAGQYKVYRAKGRGKDGDYIGSVSTAFYEDKDFVDNLWNEYYVEAFNSYGIMIGKSEPTAKYIERKPTLSIRGATRPSGTHTKGRNFAIRGVISTDCGKITYVSGIVRNSSTGSVACSASASPNSTSYDLQGHINNSLKFGNLPAGKYTYTITATAQNGNQTTTITLVSSSFTVK